MGKITLKDLKQRCENLKKQNPKSPICCVEGCNNPVDITMEGEDTSCPYHRLLHDYFLYEVDQGQSHPNHSENTIDQYRKIVSEWEKSLGKKKRDEIVLYMAQDGLNWMC